MTFDTAASFATVFPQPTADRQQPVRGTPYFGRGTSNFGRGTPYFGPDPGSFFGY